MERGRNQGWWHPSLAFTTRIVRDRAFDRVRIKVSHEAGPKVCPEEKFFVQAAWSGYYHR